MHGQVVLVVRGVDAQVREQDTAVAEVVARRRLDPRRPRGADREQLAVERRHVEGEVEGGDVVPDRGSVADRGDQPDLLEDLHVRGTRWSG